MRDKTDRIIYAHIEDQHEDTFRFVEDCGKWFGKPIEILQSPLKTVENACRSCAYVNGPHGAACTRLLKRRVRQEWESANNFFNRFNYVWGFDCDEKKRIQKRRDEMPEHDHSFPLADKNITKEEAHGILAKAGIRRPKMYDLGFPNNNCIGCVKGGMGYWNLIRRMFPDVFAARAKMERLIGATCLKKTVDGETVRIWLDDLDPEVGRDQKIILPECGAACEMAIPTT